MAFFFFNSHGLLAVAFLNHQQAECGEQIGMFFLNIILALPRRTVKDDQSTNVQ
jgi:hypothetical protein